MYNILIATSQHISLFFPLGCFLLPAPTALLRPVADSGLEKAATCLTLGTQEKAYDVETATAKRKSKSQQDEFLTG